MIKNKLFTILFLLLVIFFVVSLNKINAVNFSSANNNTYPTRVSLGPGGRIYVSDANAGSVFIYSSDLRLLGILKNLDKPLGLAVDFQGNIYVGNNGRDNIEVYSPGGALIRTIDSGEILMPNDMVLDRENNLYVVDSLKNTVKVYASDGSWIRNIGSSGKSQAALSFPVALTIVNKAGGELHVADQGHAKIQVFDRQGNFLRSYGSPLIHPEDWKEKFKRIQSIDTDSQGRVHVLDTYMHTVQILDPETGRFIDSYGSFGSGPGQLNAPLDILFTSEAKIVAANTGEQKVKDIYTMTYQDITCSENNNCPYLYNCESGTCVIAEAPAELPSSTISTTIIINTGPDTSSDTPDPSTTTTTPSEQCVFEQFFGFDNNAVTDTVRLFRDRRIAEETNLTSLYYTHSREIISILIARPNLLTRFKQITIEMLPIVKSSSHDKRTVIITQPQYMKIISLLRSINNESSSALSKTLSSILKDLDAGDLLGRMNIKIVE